MAFAQLTFRESLRDIETCLRAHSSKLYHLGIRGGVARSTLADANETRDWRIYQDFAMNLIRIARKLYADDSFAVELDNTVYALDTTTIEMSMSLFPWAHYGGTHAAVKLHTLLDLRGNIPSFLYISGAKTGELTVFDQLIFEPGSFYILDRGFNDYSRLYRLHQERAYFVIRARSNMQFLRLQSHHVDKSSGLRCDQTIMLDGRDSARKYPQPLRRVKFFDVEHDRRLVFLTNHSLLPALSIAQLYRSRWQIELFFKWIKQHLRIKAFFGRSENAVKTQIWIAVAVYVLVAIVKKRLHASASLYTVLQILSLTLFDKQPLDQLLAEIELMPETIETRNQLNLFSDISGQ